MNIFPITANAAAINIIDNNYESNIFFFSNMKKEKHRQSIRKHHVIPLLMSKHSVLTDTQTDNTPNCLESGMK
jgi:hypothetical protein